MEVLEHEGNLGGVELGFVVVQVPDAPQVVKQLTSRNVVQVDVQVSLVLTQSIHPNLVKRS